MFRIRYAGLTDVGRVREHNEDNWTADLDLGLFVVSDGMGGHAAGELASKIAVEALPQLLHKRLGDCDELRDSEVKKQVREILVDLSIQVRRQSKDQPGLDGMGATVVLILVRGDHALIAHMGDSRAYLLRRGKLKQLTKDHSLVQLLVESGDITEEEAARHPARNRITQCVGMQGEPLPEVRIVNLRGGDRILLCSDGLNGMISDDHIREILTNRWVPKTLCKRLIEEANEAGGRDNITAVVLAITEENSSPGTA